MWLAHVWQVVSCGLMVIEYNYNQARLRFFCRVYLSQ